MTNFIEYVVSELKSKRLSKSEALSLIRQFSLHATTASRGAIIHPLVHHNTSDLSQQCYTSVFTGEEHFLNDHQVKGEKVLPGVAYLEMIRAAVENAVPAQLQSGTLELRHVAWIQPLRVTEKSRVTVSLYASDEDIRNRHIEYEIHSSGMGQDGTPEKIIHCQGHALFHADAKKVTLDLDQIKGRMNREEVTPSAMYQAYREMGILFGQSHQALQSVLRGEGEVLAELRLPEAVAAEQENYQLHPGLLDSALQTSLGLAADISKLPERPSLPFALASMRIMAPCRGTRYAWVRYAEGSKEGDTVVKLDIDIFDEAGTVCVEMRGFTSRELNIDQERGIISKTEETTGVLCAVPSWEDAPLAEKGERDESPDTTRYLIVCEMPDATLAELESLNKGILCYCFSSSRKEFAARYHEYALFCFETIQQIMSNRKEGRAVIQIVAGRGNDELVYAGLQGMLKTVSMENPQVRGQIIFVDRKISAASLAGKLEENISGPHHTVVRYEGATRQVASLREVAFGATTIGSMFKDQGVYLITGGLGGLGLLFAREIMKQTENAVIIITGRSQLDPARQAALESIAATHGTVLYRQLDLADLKQVAATITAILKEHTQLNGILHCAGMIADNFIIRKSKDEFSRVLEPKVLGTHNIDLASKHVDLDFMVLFSSGASITGNSGQADYAAANGFLDQFASYRNRMVAESKRSGKTLSLNWPLWLEGGMTLDPVNRERTRERTGMLPMQTENGMQAFYQGLGSPSGQLLVVEGEPERLRQALFEQQPLTRAASSLPLAEAKTTNVTGPEDLEERTNAYIKKELSALLKLPSHKIDAEAPLEKYGIDSILAMDLTGKLEKTFGPLSKTLFFEYQSIHELTEYFLKEYPDILKTLFTPVVSELPVKTIADRKIQAKSQSENRPQERIVSRVARRTERYAASRNRREEDPIVITGLSGRYPQAYDVHAYWQNLRNGRDCIVEVPRERWDWREYYTEDRNQGGHHYSKWGGFIEGVDEFDPRFFNISPLEAESIDPQERLFLQHAWMAVEDAGYTRSTLQIPHDGDLAGQVGVYAGLMYSEYQLFGAEASLLGNRMGIGGSYASIANRVSYLLNLHGPSMTVDTMCSSSLTAIHIACQDLREGRTDLAIAGGVNVSIHPNKYLVISAGQFISSDGHCQSFGEGGDGYIPGEGVGVVILKRLSEAKRDGNHIYGIIRGSALNHGGKTNGYSVPNPKAQTSAITRAIKEARIDPRHISYIEAHGTGTRLGDPIEIAALTQAFHEYTADKGFCLIGSAKSNIGHTESAAGIAGVTKVLLQMKYKELVPSLHSRSLNPHIDFSKTPFVVNQDLRQWERPVINGQTLPLIAGISSFGAGGSNAHLIVEEYQPEHHETRAAVVIGPDEKIIVPLSARTEKQLRQKTEELLAFILASGNEQQADKPEEAISLASLAYTLQAGREAMEQRLGCLAGSIEELVAKLRAFLDGEDHIEDMLKGEVTRNKETLSLFAKDTDLQQTIDKWIAQREYSRLLDLWVKGLDLDWNKFYPETRPQFISLPAYPFARERYWLDLKTTGKNITAGTSRLHPLLHLNTSDLVQQRYSSTFTGEEFFLRDHQVKMNQETGKKVLPAVAYMEMVRAAVTQAVPEMQDAVMLELQHLVWAAPFIADKEKEITVVLFAKDRNRVDFEIYSQHHEEEVVHCQGQAVLLPPAARPRLDVQQRKEAMRAEELGAAQLYQAFRQMGMYYGPAYQGVSEISRGEGEAMARLLLPEAVSGTLDHYLLHPALLDSALQSSLGLFNDLEQLPAVPSLPFALASLRILAPCDNEMYAWIRYAAESSSGDSVTKLDIDLSDAEGNVCVEMRGLSLRELTSKAPALSEAQEERGSLLATLLWEEVPLSAAQSNKKSSATAHYLLLCNLPDKIATEIEPLKKGIHCYHYTLSGEHAAARYHKYALFCFETIREILSVKSEQNLLLQIVIGKEEDQELYAGVAGMLKTASLENPRFQGQVLQLEQEIDARELVARLDIHALRPEETLIRYEDGKQYAARLREIAAPAGKEEVSFKDKGVYLITGGLGGLGILFAREIISQTENAVVVLTGRSALTAEKQAIIKGIENGSGKVEYHRLDLSELEQVKHLIETITREYGKLDGILHSAGMIADTLIVKKQSDEFNKVLEPKVTGSYNLDQASQNIALDFMVFFSSGSSLLGNPGQADYAAANGFMDRFASYRNRLVADKQRSGKTRSIHWPLWQEGGMTIDQESREMLQRSTGAQLLQTATGMRTFYQVLTLPHAQTMVAEGDISRLRQVLFTAEKTPNEPQADDKQSHKAGNHPEIENNRLVNSAREYLRKEFSALLKLSPDEIDPKAPLETYGIDSVLAMRLTNKLEERFGPLSKTLFFEYQTVAALAGFLAKRYPEMLQQEVTPRQTSSMVKDAGQTVATNRSLQKAVSRGRFLATERNASKEIAIVGLSGRYPQADNLEVFWENLKNGKDCITEVPAERWDTTHFFHPQRNQPGKTYSKWGGFINNVDRFDPLFFNISPREAELLDPQERLFLETAWHTIEDAGYSRESIAKSRVGVYVGVMYGQYELYGAEAIATGDRLVPGSSYASIANRVSYFLNLHGPSIALDTMCSSSLTAIHLACTAIAQGEIDAAIAGGVNLSVHPHKYVMLSQGNFVASDGRCRSFGDGGDGYVPGEGVGAVLLKPLEQAVLDGDHIYGVIKGSSLNHGGKTNGYTVPNPNAQAEVILEALRKAGIDPKTLGYIETHGTGTILGDPIEITGLMKAFEAYQPEQQFCPIGSVKSNIGHLESAAGIASVTKSLLQLQHKELVPSLHADTLNPHIDFEASPFYVQREHVAWNRSDSIPRRVGISSFGAGGANAHLILEEYPGIEETAGAGDYTEGPEAFLLSARDHDALCRYAEAFIDFFEQHPRMPLEHIAYTSQVGRTPLQERLVLIANSLDELKDGLQQWLRLTHDRLSGQGSGSTALLSNVYWGNIKDTASEAGNLIEGEAGSAFLEVIVKERDLAKLAKLWISGVEIDWSLLYQGKTPQRASLPVYPFARERYWIELPAHGVSRRPGPAVRSIPVSSSQEMEKEAVSYYYPQWQEVALTETSDLRLDHGPLLLFDTDEEYYQAIKTHPDMKEAENPIILVKTGDAYQEINETSYMIDPEQEAHYARLTHSLQSRKQLPRYLVHHGMMSANPVKQEAVERELANGFYALFNLVKAFIAQKSLQSLHIVSVFEGDEGLTVPHGSALGGFFKSLSLEHPGYHAKTIEIQVPDGGAASGQKADLVLRELQEHAWQSLEIRYQFDANGESCSRHERSIARYLPARHDMSRLPLRQQGVYLVTGGLGGLGFIFSEYLAKNFQARLVLLGRSPLSGEHEQKFRQLENLGSEVLYLQVDVSRYEDVASVVKKVKRKFSAIHGIIHAAGVTRDAFILKKEKREIEQVLAAKVFGTVNLDEATREEQLDLFVMFSSVSGVMGNVGQADYAYGNHFLDSFAENRGLLKSRGQRFGKTLSINWPYWKEGGMELDPETIALTARQSGITPLPTSEGIRCWESLLPSDLDQGIVLHGVSSRIAHYLARPSLENKNETAVAVAALDGALLGEKTAAYLKRVIGEETKISPEKIDPRERLESFGIDSVMINRINLSLERDLGALPKTLLYEHETIEELVAYLLKGAGHSLQRFFNLEDAGSEESTMSLSVNEVRTEATYYATETIEEEEPVAIIGMHGLYPHSRNLDEYWENLKLGKDLVDTVPPTRWDSEAFYDPDPEKAGEGKIYCKWGGFLDNVDRFDPRFFNISEEEARMMDPQERLFLESVWAAIEDAGYTRESLKQYYPKARSADVGVFVGVTTNTYQLLATEEWNRGNIVSPGAMPWSIANRVSYFFDFQGPSMPVDTACSSSLVAMHLACESLKRQECQLAVVGGVNLYLHPLKYYSFCKKRMLAQHGKCRSFGSGDEGFVPGEGVGTMVLKPLRRAIRDNDRIYAVVAASAFDHSGRSNGYSAPNPKSQTSLIGETLRKAGVNPETVTCIEGHGTGTQLGDSLEIASLTNAFQQHTAKKQFCSVGSVKANIGHSESASGMAGVAKVLLQMQHKQLVPTIHSEEANPNIDFNDSPFYLQHSLADWQETLSHPRRALVNSFGAGGVNACVLLEEYRAERQVSITSADKGPCLFVLSARDNERLKEYAVLLRAYLLKEEDVDLLNMSYTLQLGREAMQERLAIIASDRQELVDRLRDWENGVISPLVYQAHCEPYQGMRKKATQEEEERMQAALAANDLERLATSWCAGEKPDWEKLYTMRKPTPMTLPTYPFARERYWVADAALDNNTKMSVREEQQLHPLLSYNASTLKEIRFCSLLSDNAFYALDHQVHDEKIFPGSGFLEIACVAGSLAGEDKVCKMGDIVWVQPLNFQKGTHMVQTALKPAGNRVEYSIFSLDDENERVVHSEGHLSFAHDNVHGAETISIQTLKDQASHIRDGSHYYTLFKKFGFSYGPAFQTIQELYLHDTYALSFLRVADNLKNDFDQFVLHPSILDGALQTVIGLAGDLETATPYLPFAIDEIVITRPLPSSCYVYVEFAQDAGDARTDLKKFNIKVVSEKGELLVTINNFYVRAFEKPASSSRDSDTAKNIQHVG